MTSSLVSLRIRSAAQCSVASRRAVRRRGHPHAVVGLAQEQLMMGGIGGCAPKVRFASDSPLEGGVSCELVSENAKIPC
jgi:hypothetical protein